MFTTGDKLLNMMKEEEVSIMELSRMSGVPERTIMDILAGIREPELGVVCRIADVNHFFDRAPAGSHFFPFFFIQYFHSTFFQLFLRLVFFLCTDCPVDQEGDLRKSREKRC